MGNTLSEKLKEGSREIHSEIEKNELARRIESGKITFDEVKRLIAGYFFIYSVLERALEENREHLFVQAVYHRELLRREAIKEDLLFYFGENWAKEIHPSISIQIYCKRIEEVSKYNKELLLSHAYVRYMGDLSGGQIIKKWLGDALNLTDRGLTFYNFNQIQDINEFKSIFKKGIDMIPADDETSKRIVEESILVFLLNINMFNEIVRGDRVLTFNLDV